MFCNLDLATWVGRVKHQRKGLNNTAKKTTRVDIRMRVLLGMIVLMEGGRIMRAQYLHEDGTGWY